MDPSKIVYHKEHKCEDCNKIIRTKTLTAKQYFEERHISNPKHFDTYLCKIQCLNCKNIVKIITYSFHLKGLKAFGDYPELDKQIIEMCKIDEEDKEDFPGVEEYGTITKSNGTYSFCCNSCNHPLSRNQILHSIKSDKKEELIEIDNKLSKEDRLLLCPPTEEAMNKFDTYKYDTRCEKCSLEHKMKLFIQNNSVRDKLINQNLCPICKKPSQDGVWCSLDCAIVFVKLYNLTLTCPYCDKKIEDPYDKENHHLFYIKEITVNMHKTCHTKQHSKFNKPILNNDEKRKSLRPR